MAVGILESPTVWSRLAAVLLLAGLTGAGCASRLSLPTGPGTPRSDAQQLFIDATAGCRGVRTLTAELALSGRADGRRIRSGRVLIGLTNPGAVYIEAPSPFGPPVFVLGAQGDRGTLLMPRDRRAVADAPVRDMLNAMAGLDLDAASLRALLTGCVAPDPQPRQGREYPGWVAVDLAAGAVAWLRLQDDGWRVVAGEHAGLLVEYSGYSRSPVATPRELHVRTVSSTAASVDLRLSLSQVDMNVPLDPATFAVQIPPETELLTVDELRSLGLLAP